MSNDTAVCLMNFKRPHYTEKVIEGMEEQPDKNTVDWHLYQEAAVNTFSGLQMASQGTIERSLKLLQEADLPNKHVHKNDEGIGISRQVDRIFHLLDDDYDRLILVENDNVPGKHWLRLQKLLLDQFPDCLTSMHREFDPSDIDIESNLDKVIKSDSHHARCLGITRDIWEEIMFEWQTYIHILDDNSLMIDTPFEQLDHTFCQGAYSHDRVLSYIARRKGIPRVKPVISRMRDIGEKGYSHSPKKREGRDLGNEGQLTYEKDTEIDEFTVKRTEEIRGPDDSRV